VRAAAKRMRGGKAVPDQIHGDFIHAPVWTWEVPLYFWFGGIATGSSFVGVACDAVGDGEAAAIARKVTLAAVVPCAPLLILDLGRPMRFLHMLRIFKVRSPMSMGAWCLSAFSGAAAAGVLADLLGREPIARAAGGGAALLGTYLGSYTGVLLASTAVPVWARSRALLPPSSSAPRRPAGPPPTASCWPRPASPSATRRVRHSAWWRLWPWWPSSPSPKSTSAASAASAGRSRRARPRATCASRAPP
jgi:hypothetical protein